MQSKFIASISPLDKLSSNRFPSNRFSSKWLFSKNAKVVYIPFSTEVTRMNCIQRSVDIQFTKFVHGFCVVQLTLSPSCMENSQELDVKAAIRIYMGIMALVIVSQGPWPKLVPDWYRSFSFWPGPGPSAVIDIMGTMVSYSVRVRPKQAGPVNVSVRTELFIFARPGKYDR